MMLTRLNDCNNRVVGSKQTRKALKNEEVEKLFIAKDADEKVIYPLIDLAKDNNIPITYADSMYELGKASGIDVKAACAAILK